MNERGSIEITEVAAILFPKSDLWVVAGNKTSVTSVDSAETKSRTAESENLKRGEILERPQPQPKMNNHKSHELHE